MSKNLRVKYLKDGLKFIEDKIGTDKINSFVPTCSPWSGDPHDLSLYLFWKKTKIELDSSTKSALKREKLMYSWKSRYSRKGLHVMSSLFLSH